MGYFDDDQLGQALGVGVPTPAGQPFDLGAAMGMSPPPKGGPSEDMYGGMQQWMGLQPPSTGLAPPPAPPPQPAPPPAPAPALQARPEPPKRAVPVKPLTPEQEYRRAADEQAALSADLGKREGQHAEDQGRAKLEALEERKARQEQDDQFRQETDQKIAQQRASVQGEIDQLSKTKIDPNRLFREQSTAANIADAIAIALGAFNASKTGGVNLAMQIVQKQIDQDINAQMTDIDTKRATIGAKQTLLQSDMAAGASAVEARAKATALQWDYASKKIEAMGEASSNPIIQEKTAIAAAEAKQKAAQVLNAMDDQKRQIAISQQNANTSSGQLSLAKQQAAVENQFGIQDRAMRALAASAKTANPEVLIPNAGPGGVPLAAVSKERAGKMTEDKIALEGEIYGFRRLKELREQNPGQSFLAFMHTPEGRQQMQLIAADLVAGKNVRMHQGAMGDAEREAAIRDQIGDFGKTVFDQHSEVKWNEGIRSAERFYNTALRSSVTGFKGGLTYDYATGQWKEGVLEFPEEQAKQAAEDAKSVGGTAGKAVVPHRPAGAAFNPTQPFTPENNPFYNRGGYQD